MQATLQRLNHWITEVPIRVHSLSEHDLCVRNQPDKWSKKEILGHLCDSALTNLQRFIRAQYEPQPHIVLKYAQNQWVELMDYENLSVDHVLNLWTSLNKQASQVIVKIPGDRLQYSCDNEGEHFVTLEWIIKDYVDHMEHHLKQIFTK
jgi:hypothetical protein